MVEGDSDRYFFKAVLQFLYPSHDQEIAILQVAGKNELQQWTELFEVFGLKVYRIADLDYSYERFYQNEEKLRLRTAESVLEFKRTHADCEERIANEYANGTFILARGTLELYLGIKKGLSEMIDFCNYNLGEFLGTDASLEIRNILEKIVA